MPTISTTALTTSGRAVTRLTRSFELVAHTPHGLDVLGQIRVLLHLFPQAADVDGDRALVAEKGLVPDTVEQGVPADDLAGVLHQVMEQIELFRGKCRRLPPDQAGSLVG